MNIAPQIAGAVRAHAAGKLDEARAGCLQVLASDPHNVQANMLLGVVEVKIGHAQEGILRLERVREDEPGSIQAPLWLSIAYRQMNCMVPAIQYARDVVAIGPRDPQGHAQLGLCYLDIRMLPEAEESLRRAGELAPGVADIQFNLSRSIYLQGRWAEASELLCSILDRRALDKDALVNLGRSFLAAGYAAGTLECARRALAFAPELVAAHILVARALLSENHASEAELELRAAVELNPLDAEAVAMLGDTVRIQGRIGEASHLFSRSIDLRQVQGYAYCFLNHNGKLSEADRPRIEKMELLAADPGLPAKQKGYLQYGLGKGYEDLGDYELAMSSYDEANRIERELKFHGNPFDQEASADSVTRTKRQFTKALLESGRDRGNPSEQPVFVVGMMRSGTTLVEQILSSHPQVGAAGEQTFWSDNWRSAMNPTGALNKAGLPSLAGRYLALLGELAPALVRVVDKMPNNHAHLGFIHLAFPNARIVHVRRHPADTCLSIWTTPNSASVEFLHDRDSIVHAYRNLARLSDHWRAVLPPEVYHEVQYENLVADRERVTREMIRFLGLEWSDACMTPEKNERAVVTPSVWQVRQPVYATSIRRWQKFERWLGAFRDLL